MSAIVGIALAGGLGVRARPITLGSPGQVRSKATIRLLGRPLIEWQLDCLHEQGVNEICVVAKGQTNRGQIRDVVGYGERHGVRVRYSRPRHDRMNVGSGESTLRNIDGWDLDGLALVFPTDSVFEFDLGAMAHEHLASGAVLTVGTVGQDADTVAGKYGALVTDPAGRCTRFLEKPTRAAIRSAFGRTEDIDTNAGLYLVDCRYLRSLFRSGRLVGMLGSRLDWGRDLLPWLVASGAPVRVWPIERFGDVGSPRDYLDTMRAVLAGDYPQLTKMLATQSADQSWVHQSSLRLRDPMTGRTLAERIRLGQVDIGPGVRIGQDVEIGTGARITNSDIADGVDVGEGCDLRGVACMPGAMVGPHARLRDTYVGTMALLDSVADRPVHADGYTAIGDEVTVGPGVRLSGAIIHPGLTVIRGDQHEKE
ncbi:MAG TPA: NDP-sugar synthase [Pseudonocardiaceae bacterium]|nr:NDP-sugar synthase [Pseudonocardiaceae bacterium]